ncbi:MAG TPA: MOSC domain-containing protein [Candidatus Limnocylindria bacterium]|nr:MOSC domain-containing protein [Candidatus Limnocylindria bacterium]
MPQIGCVASLHLHPEKSGEPLRSVEQIEVVAEKGIRGNPRKFGAISRSTGQPSKRQVSLMEREQIGEHAATLGLQSIPPGAVRSNIETLGIDLVALVGREVRVGEAILFFYEARMPCEKMDRICQGLRALMEERRQGVLAQVIQGGMIRVGDEVTVLAEPGIQEASATAIGS